MIGSVTLLILCQLVGEVAARATALPVPGPVVGLLLMLVVLLVRRGLSAEMRSTTWSLLRNMTPLFVPAGVGVVTQLDVLRQNALAVVASVLIATALGMATTAWVMQRLARGRANSP